MQGAYATAADTYTAASSEWREFSCHTTPVSNRHRAQITLVETVEHDHCMLPSLDELHYVKRMDAFQDDAARLQLLTSIT